MPIEPTHSGELLRIGDQLIRFDRSCTEAQYKTIETRDAEKCGCSHCRNFIAQRTTAYPTSFRDLLDRLGIDASKEGEVYGCWPTPSGKRLYGGWFFFCGELLEAGEQRVESDGIAYWVRGPGKMPAPGRHFGGEPLALEFQTEISWVLANEDPDENARRPAAQ
jgi:hypothetical protein